MVLAELTYGAKSSANRTENLRKLYELVSLLGVAEFDERCADIHGDIRLALQPRGKPSGEADMLIAATAIANEATLVTNNQKHFEAIEGLKLVNWVG